MEQGKDFPAPVFLSLTCEERLAGYTLGFERILRRLLATQEKYLSSVGSWRHDGKVLRMMQSASDWIEHETLRNVSPFARFGKKINSFEENYE
jgi:hypothetical protein